MSATRGIVGAVGCAFVAAAVWLVHCGAGGGAGATCPADPPRVGSACDLAEGTTCSAYPAPGCACCSAPSYVCTGGRWSETGGGGPPSGAGTAAGCPATTPQNGAACASNPCEGAQLSCTYDCATTARCIGGSWSVSTSNIRCASDASTDASDAADAADASDASDDGG